MNIEHSKIKSKLQNSASVRIKIHKKKLEIKWSSGIYTKF